MVKQSVVLPIFTNVQQPLGALLGEIRAMGYAAVEIWGRSGVKDFHAFVEAAHNAGLVVASMGGHSSLADGLNKTQNHERIVEELRESIDLAVRYDIPGVICFSGNRQPGQSDAEGLEACASGLSRIAPYAEEKGINLNLELLNSRIDHAGYLADSSAWGIALCEKVDSPRVKLLFDIYHMQVMEGDLIRTIRGAIKHIGHFHTAGNPGRNEFDDSQELNYRGICRAIDATGYSGFVGHEFRPTRELLGSLRQAFEVCNA